MRIIAGEAGGRRIRCPPGQGTRPTSDRVRESLFSILGAPMPGMRVLDLFAGAGTLGLEALSRGAAEVVFIERDRGALRCLRENIANLGYMDRTHVIRGDAVRGLASVRGEFGWIFADPPYRTELAERILDQVGGTELLEGSGTLVIEHDRRRELPDRVGILEKSQSRRYGDTQLTLYRRDQARTGGNDDE